MATVEPCAPHKARSPAPNAPGHAHCQLWGVGLPQALRRPCAEGRGASASGAGRCRPLPPAPSLFAWSAAATTTRHTIAPVTKQPARAPPTSCFHSSRWQSSAPTSRSHLTPSAACASGAHTHTTGTAGHTQPPKPDGPGGCPLGGHKRAKAGAGSEGHGNTSAKGESRARQGCSRGRPTPAARGPLPAAPLLPSAPFPFPPAGPQDATRRPPDAGRPSAPSGGARPLAVSRGGLPWTPQAPGTTKPPRKPPELGWRRRRKAGRPSAETAVCGRAARRRRWPGQLGPGGGTGSLRGHLGGATWRKGAVSHDTWPQQRLRRVQGPLCRSVTSGHGQCALPGRSHSLT